MKSKFKIQVIKNNKPINQQSFEERKYLLFPNDNAVTSTLFSNEVYEPYLYQFLTDNNLSIEGTNVIDVGGNNGQIAIEFAHLVGDSGKVFTFEPQRIIFQQLCGNVFMNGLDNVWAFNMAIGQEDGLTKIEKPDYFQQGPVNFGNVHVGQGEQTEVVRLQRLDSFGIENVSIIKIDVQGYEVKVLLGAKETINKSRPIIYIEIEDDQLELYGYTKNSVFEVLKDMNYSWTRFNDGMPYQTTSGLCLDFVAIPDEFVNSKKWKTIFH
jgi:FkbM family methyltransferase